MLSWVGILQLAFIMLSILHPYIIFNILVYALIQVKVPFLIVTIPRVYFPVNQPSSCLWYAWEVLVLSS